MNKPNPKDQKYFEGQIFLDQAFMNDTDTYVSLIEQQTKELIEENKGIKVQALALQDAVNELLEENQGLKTSVEYYIKIINSGVPTTITKT